MDKLFFNDDLALKNIRFIVGTIKVSCTDYDSVTHQYVTRFTVDSFSNFTNSCGFSFDRYNYFWKEKE